MKLRFLVLIVFLILFPRLAVSQQAAKPMSKDQIMSVVTAGMDNAELAKKIEERGIDFDLTDDYLQALRKAGAQEVVIKALRMVKPSPMSRDQLLMLVASGVPSERATALVKQRGVDFMPDEKLLESLRTAGADDALIAVVREAKPLEVERHLTRAADFEQKRAWEEAGQEYRAALTLAPGNAEILKRAGRAAKALRGPEFRLVKTLAYADFKRPAGHAAISPDGRWLVLGNSTDVGLWEVPTGRSVFAGSEGPSGGWSLALSADGRLLASTSASSYAQLWDVATGKLVRTLSVKNDMVYSVTFTPDGQWLAAGCMYGSVRLWELATGREVRALKGHTDNVNSLALSPDGRWLASGSDDKTDKLREVATGRQVRTFEEDDWVRSLVFSPDSQWLASGTRNGTVKVREVITGREILTLRNNFFIQISFSPDGSWLALQGDSWLVSHDALDTSFWEVATGRKLSDLPIHGVVCIALTPDWKWLAAATDDFKIEIWQRQD
jgi:hypothetical protein